METLDEKGLPYDMMKLPQSEAGYTAYGADPASGRGCATCRWYNMHMSCCHIVEGEISPTGLSDWFTPMYPEMSVDELLTEILPESGDSQPVEAMSEATAYANVGKRQTFWERLKTLWQKSESGKQLFDTPAGFKMLNEDRWLAWYTNGYKDRDEEWCATKAIEADTARIWETKQFPELWYWHIGDIRKGWNPTRHGVADWVGNVGRFAVATGTFDNTPFAEKMKIYYREQEGNIGISQGFFYNPEKKKGGVYYEFHTFEISTLPAEKASNPYTPFAIIKGVDEMGINEEQSKALASVLGEKEAQALLTTAEQATKELDQHIAFKAKEDSEDDTEDKENPKAKKEDYEGMKKSVSDLEAQMADMTSAIKTLAELIIAEKQEQQAEKSAAPKAAQTPIPFDKRRVDLLADMQENKQKQIDVRSNDAGANLFNAFFTPQR